MNNTPFVVRNHTLHWLAHQNFKNDSYLLEKLSNVSIKVE
jgi:hypothetical protein